MSDTPSMVSLHRAPLGFVDRIVALTSWAVGGAVFLTIGWNAMAPNDPLGAVSVLSRTSGLAMVLQAAGLAAVCAAVATILAGRKLVDVGTFAVAVGLSLVSLRGGTVSSMLQQSSAVGGASEHALAAMFALEAMAWFAVMLVALVASAGIMTWVFAKPRSAGKSAQKHTPPECSGELPAGLDVPWFSSLCFGEAGRRGTVPAEGLKHATLCAGVGLVVVSALSASLTARSIEHGQVCFVIVASVLIASYVAHRVVPVRSACWSIVGVALMAVAAYVWAAVRPSVASLPPLVPSSHFLRILPIQFVSVGVATAIVAAWYNLVPEPEDRPAK